MTLNREEHIFSGISLSVALHAALVSFFLIKTVFFKVEEIDYKAAIHVDLVGLPDKLDPNQEISTQPKEDATKNTPPPTHKAEEKVKEMVLPQKQTQQTDAIKLKETKKSQKEALEKLKRESALEKIREDLAKEHISNLAKKSSAKTIKGNVVSQGSALQGLAKLELNEYATTLDHHIKKSWLLPEWLSGKNYQTQVRVFISKSGSLVGKNIIQSSGNNEYDQAALSTIDSSAPFPPPPEIIAESIENRGFVVFFP